MGREAFPTVDRIRGCLLGGAVGDALGAPVESLTLDQIRGQFGPEGIRQYAPAFGRAGAITANTQMTLFTAEGVIRARSRMCDRGLTNPPIVMHRAYLRWLGTQGKEITANDLYPGWLSGVQALYARRAPGKTCIGALRQPVGGTCERPLNNSKGCGGVVRVAPLGLVCRDPEYTFELATQAAALTHGHPTGYLAAGAFAFIIHRVARGAPLREAITGTLDKLRPDPRAGEVVAAIEGAVAAAAQGATSARTIETLGGGWVAEEALAIALYCALTADSFDEGVIRAVNHGGDSDSTAAIAGNILGAMLGARSIGGHWLRDLELRDEIEMVAADLSDWFDYERFEPQDEDFVRYPPN